MRLLTALLGVALASPASAQVNPDVKLGLVFQDDREIGVVLYLPDGCATDQTWYLYPGFEAPTLRNRLALTVQLSDPPEPDVNPPQPDRVLAEAQARHPGGTLIRSRATPTTCR